MGGNINGRHQLLGKLYDSDTFVRILHKMEISVTKTIAHKESVSIKFWQNWGIIE